MKKTTIFNPGIGKPKFGLPLKFGLPKNVKGGKPKFSVYLLVYRSVYREMPINKGVSIKVNQVNQEYIKELVVIDVYTKKERKGTYTRVRTGNVTTIC